MPMGKMKKGIVLLLLVSLLLLTFAACRPSGGNSSVTTKSAETGTQPAGDGRSAAVSTLPSDLSFGNISVNLAVRDREDILFEIDPDFNTVDVLATDIARRNEAAQNALNVNIELKKIPGTWAEREAFQTTVRNNSQLNADEVYDAVFGPYYSLVPLMLEGYFQNLNEAQYLNLNNPWWNNRFVYECSYLDKLYMVEGELTLSMLDSAFVMFYDTQLYSNFTKNGESIYDIVSDQEWTLEKLGGIVKDVYADDGDGIRNAADTFGLVSPAFACGRDGFPTAFNVKVAWKDDEGKIASDFNTQRNIDIYENFYKFLHENDGVFVNGNNDGARTGAQDMFQNGQAMFITELLNYANIVRGLDRNYGVIPLPKYDTDQTDYATNSEAVHSQISIGKSSAKKAATEAVLEQMCFLTYRDVTMDYYRTVKYRNQREEESVKMLDIILGSITSNFGAQFSSEITSPFPTPIGEEQNISTGLSGKKEMVDALLLNLKRKIYNLDKTE